MKAYIFLSLGILATFVEAKVQREILGRCDRNQMCPEGQEPFYDRDQYSIQRCNCAKKLTLYETAVDKGGGCANFVDSCKKGDPRSCHIVTGDDCKRPNITDFPIYSGDFNPFPGVVGVRFSDTVSIPIPGQNNAPANRTGIPNVTNNEVNGKCQISEPVCEYEKIVELCDQRYITFAHLCARARKEVAAKNEAKCKQAQNQCKSEAYFANSCSTLLNVCTAPDIVEYCKAGERQSNIPENTCNDYRVRLGIEIVPLVSGSFRIASDRECESYKQHCIDGNNSACDLVIRQCKSNWVNDICKAGKVNDIYRCNVAKASTEGPSYYCNQHLSHCFFFDTDDCDLALRYCDDSTIQQKCSILGRPSKLCTNFETLTSRKKYSDGQCSQYISDCNFRSDSMACKEVMYHCNTDAIKNICYQPTVWAESMCKETKARLNIGSFGSIAVSVPRFQPVPVRTPAQTPRKPSGGFNFGIGFP